MEGQNVYTDVMVDIETTSTLPDRGAILQIAAVKFNLKTGDVSPDYFDECLMIPPHRCWSEGTRNFWANQKHEVLYEILKRAEPWQEVMQRFLEFSYPVNHLRFWSKPSHFDYMFISSYCHDMNMVTPFHYREATDMNSYLRGLYAPNNVPDVNLEFQGEVHNALWDTFHQVKVLLHHVHEKKPELDTNKYTPKAGEVTDVEVKD